MKNFGIPDFLYIFPIFPIFCKIDPIGGGGGGKQKSSFAILPGGLLFNILFPDLHTFEWIIKIENTMVK